MINVHGPTNEKRKEIKEEFYNLREQNINQIATCNSDIKIIIGDFNAKVGKENFHKPTTGNEIKHNDTNKNGIKMIQLAIYRVIHKSLRDFRTRLRNNQDRHGRKEHINR